MTIQKSRSGSSLVFSLEGQLTALTAPQLNEQLTAAVSEAEEIIIDMEHLDYLASAGIRVLLTVHKQMMQKGKRLILRRIREDLLDIFDVTGMSECLTIEK